MQDKSFLFIGDLLEIKDSLPLNLFEDFYLVKASQNQVSNIKHYLDKYLNILPYTPNRYEITQENLSGSGHNVVQLEPKDWRYFIIEHSKSQAKNEIEEILSLSSLNLTVLFESVQVGIIINQLRTLTYLLDESFFRGVTPLIKYVKKNFSDELKNINYLLSNFDKNKFSYIDKAIRDFVSIKDISERSPFKILGCFSILELLLTSFRPNSSNDNSISNQLQKKINLVNNQSINKIDVAKYFKGPDTLTIEIIISKLYQYRNDIAHGNLSDFENDLQIFKNQKEKILPFLLDLLKQVLITSLEKPQLISDLKVC